MPTGTGFHALRHYYASLLIRHGDSVKTVQSRLGHANAIDSAFGLTADGNGLH